MTDLEAYLALIDELDGLVALFEQHPDQATRERAVALLGGLDALHRQALHRLAEHLRVVGGQTLIDRLTADPVVEILFGLYDLVPLAPPRTPPDPSGFVPLEAVDLLAAPPDPHPGRNGLSADRDTP